MTRSAVVIGGTALSALALVGIGAASARQQADSITIATVLTAAQEVPAPKGDVGGARGTFTAKVTKSDTGGVVAWTLTFAGLSGPAAAAHIHSAPAGQSGPVIVPLCGPCESPASGTANVSAATLATLQSGDAYANVHTPTNGAGEIRGQLRVTAAIATALTARQEVPRPKGNANRARGAFTAIVTKSGTETRLGWRLSFSRLTGRAVAAHIHLGRRGRSGPVAVTLCGPCRSGVRKSVSLQPAVVAALEAGNAYVNVHTARNPAGEIRGQIAAVPLALS